MTDLRHARMIAEEQLEWWLAEGYGPRELLLAIGVDPGAGMTQAEILVELAVAWARLPKRGTREAA